MWCFWLSVCLSPLSERFSVYKYGHRRYFWYTPLTFLSTFHHSNYLSLLLLFESTRCRGSPVHTCDSDCHPRWQHGTFPSVEMCATCGTLPSLVLAHMGIVPSRIAFVSCALCVSLILMSDLQQYCHLCYLCMPSLVEIGSGEFILSYCIYDNACVSTYAHTLFVSP